MNPVFIFLFMLFCHVFDDYVLQGCLANLKQKQWWKDHASDAKYQKDYIAALICHSISWSFMIMLPISIATHFYTDPGSVWLLLMFPVNVIAHAITDDAKANKLSINLIMDQGIHLSQIIMTFTLYLCYYIA